MSTNEEQQQQVEQNEQVVFTDESLHSIVIGTKLITTLNPQSFRNKKRNLFNVDMFHIYPQVYSMEFHIPKETYEEIKKGGGLCATFSTDKELKIKDKRIRNTYVGESAIVALASYCGYIMYFEQKPTIKGTLVSISCGAIFGFLDYMYMKSVVYSYKKN